MIKHPPAHLCVPCQDVWAAWSDAPMTTTQLDGGGEGRRLQIIAQQQADVVWRCAQAGHERNRAPAPTRPVEPAPVQPVNILGARAKQLMDEFEALLPDDGLTREERLARALEQERVARLHLKRTGQHLELAENTEGVA